jgi:hypothetical protein
VGVSVVDVVDGFTVVDVVDGFSVVDVVDGFSVVDVVDGFSVLDVVVGFSVEEVVVVGWASTASAPRPGTAATRASEPVNRLAMPRAARRRRLFETGISHLLGRW